MQLSSSPGNTTTDGCHHASDVKTVASRNTSVNVDRGCILQAAANPACTAEQGVGSKLLSVSTYTAIQQQQQASKHSELSQRLHTSGRKPGSGITSILLWLIVDGGRGSCRALLAPRNSRRTDGEDSAVWCNNNCCLTGSPHGVVTRPSMALSGDCLPFFYENTTLQKFISALCNAPMQLSVSGHGANNKKSCCQY